MSARDVAIVAFSTSGFKVSEYFQNFTDKKVWFHFSNITTKY